MIASNSETVIIMSERPVTSPSPSALVFCASPSERLRVKFDGLHAALERTADQRPGFTCGDQVEKPFFLFRRPAYPRHYAVISSPSAQLYKLTRYRRGGVSYWLSVWTFDQLECGNVSGSQPRL